LKGPSQEKKFQYDDSNCKRNSGLESREKRQTVLWRKVQKKTEDLSIGKGMMDCKGNVWNSRKKMFGTL